MNRLNENANLNDIDSKITILPFSYVDNSRYIKVKKQNALSIVRTYDKLIFFVTFICNFE